MQREIFQWTLSVAVDTFAFRCCELRDSSIVDMILAMPPCHAALFTNVPLVEQSDLGWYGLLSSPGPLLAVHGGVTTGT